MSDRVQKPQDSAPFFLELITKKKISPQQLTTHQRRVCVRFLLQDMKYTQAEIGTLMGVNESTISRDHKRIMEQNAWYVDDIDERKWVVDMIQTSHVACARLFRKGKEKEAFEVKSKCIEILQSMGYIGKKPLQLELSFQEVLKNAAKIPIDPRATKLLSGSSGQIS